MVQNFRCLKIVAMAVCYGDVDHPISHLFKVFMCGAHGGIPTRTEYCENVVLQRYRFFVGMWNWLTEAGFCVQADHK